MLSTYLLVLFAKLSAISEADIANSYWQWLNGADWKTILDLHFERGTLVFNIGPILLILLVVVIVVSIAWKTFLRKKFFPDYDVVEAELGIANIGKISIRPNRENVQIAHAAWVELSTRKAALPFDEDNDVVTEVYDSYYKLFGRLRDLTKSIPAHKLRKCKDTKQLVLVMVRVLNYGLRPHLTRWQARFRRWYEQALVDPSNRNNTPQEIQKQFPEFEALVDDIKTLQVDVVRYGRFLCDVAQGEEKAEVGK